jgi:hypothetical protein
MIMRILAAVMAMTACIGSAAACAHAQSEISSVRTEPRSTALCALTSRESLAGRELVADAASDLAGRWELQLGGPALSLQQSGVLEPGQGGYETLARIQLSGPASGPVSLDDLKPGQTVTSADAGPLFGALTILDAEGRIVCSAQWEDA